MNDTKRGPDWVCVSPRSDWQARDSQGEFVYDGHLWILGGWYTPQTPNPRDVWKSPNGKQWTCTVDVAPWEHSDLSATLVFGGKMWLMGGRKLPGAENSNQVWSSTDGAAWTLETDAAGWSPRVSAAHAVFRERMWILGGTGNFYDHSQEMVRNDVWHSADGVAWKQATAHAGWAQRAHAQVVVFRGKLWLLGGGLWEPQHTAYHDVWCSEDGVHWDEVTPAAPWAPRLWFSAMVYRDHIWVLGGWSREHGNFGDVWFSADGKEWTRLESEMIWGNRHEHSAYVFKDQLWVAGGYADVLTSDVWTLRLPEGWSG